MTPDLFTRLAYRAIGDAGLTMRPEPEPEPARYDDDAVGPASEADAPPVLDTSAAADAMRSPADQPGKQVATGPVRRPVMPVLLPVPGPRPDPAPADLAPTTPRPVRPAAATLSSRSGPGEAASDDGPADADTRPLRYRAGMLEPPPLPVIEPPALALDRQPALGADPRTSVEVTVGRIEIRVRPPAPGDTVGSRRAASPAPALSLEEYLRRREASS